MMNAVGVIELNSIARGIEVADHMLKTSSVELLEAKSICPGKYLILITGDVSAVESSVEVGLELAKSFFVDYVVIPNVSDEVVYALRGIPDVEEFKAVGVLEFFSVTGAVYSADAAVKTSDVDIASMRLGYALGGKSFVILTGDLSAVEAAIESGTRVGEENGFMFNTSVIPSPDKALITKLV